MAFFNNKIVLEGLNDCVRTYYPIEEDISNDEFDGFKSLKKIVSNKLEALESQTLPIECYTLVDKIVEKFSDSLIHIKYYTNFPSYSITVNLASQTSNNIQTLSNLNLHISLLTNYYTLYFEEQSWFHGFTKVKGKKSPPLFRILSSINLNLDPEAFLFNSTKEILESTFLTNKFVGHSLLFNYKLPNGVPFGCFDRIQNYYPIFAFLFDNWIDLPTTTIIN